jgi:outer membrane protein assembly factor BamB
MKDSDQQHTEFADDQQVQITDLDLEEMPQRKRATQIVALLSLSVKTPWRRYSLIGACLLILIGALFLQTQEQMPAPTRPPTALHTTILEALTATSTRMYIQTRENVLAAHQTANGQALWHDQLPGPATLLATDQAVYCYFVDSHQQNILEALNVNNGQLLWSHTLPTTQTTGEIVLQQSGTILLLSGLSNTIYAIQRNNGQIAWNYQVHNQETDLTPGQNEIVTVQESATTIDILNEDDGWEMTHFPTVFDRNLPTIDGPLISVFSDSGQSANQNIQVFRSSDGQRLWNLTLANNTSVINEKDGVIYLRGPDNSTLTALRDSDGQRLWTYTTSDGQPFIDTPVEQDSILYLIQHDDTLVGIHVSNGQRAWQRQLPPLDEQSGGMQLLLDQGIIFLSTPPQGPGNHQSIMTEALRASDGSILWDSSKLAGTPLVQSGVLYSLQANGQLDAWRTSDGQHLWQAQASVGSKLAPGLMYNPALVFLVNELGEIATLRASTGTLLWNYPASVS